VADFPETEVRSLLGEKRTFPADLPARRTVVVAAFLREQQEQVDRWIDALTEAGLPGSPHDMTDSDRAVVIELPVLPSTYRLARRMIDGGMSRSIAIDRVLARTFTTYTDVAAFRKAVAIPTPRVEVLVVTRLGEIIDRASGEPNEFAVTRLSESALASAE